MNFNVSNHSQTGQLPELESFSTKKISFDAPVVDTGLSVTHESAELSVLDKPFEIKEVSFHKGDSPVSVAFFPEKEESSFSAPSLGKSLAAERGERLLNDLYLRQGRGVNKSYGSLDYTIAKLRREGPSLTTQHLESRLSELLDKLRGLDNPDAPPLSAEEVRQFNASLKQFGLMTDGLQLYNLTNRVPTGDSAQRRPAVLMRREAHQLKDVCRALIELNSSQVETHESFLTGKKPAPISPDTTNFGFSLSKPSDSVFPSLGQDLDLLVPGSQAVLAQDELSVLTRITEYQPLIVNSEDDIEASIKEVNALISEQTKVHKDLSDALVQGEKVFVQIQTEQKVLGDLTSLLERFPDGLPILEQPEQASTVNQIVNPLGLEVKLAANGSTLYFHQGKEVSASQFQGVLHQEVLAKQSQLQTLNTKALETKLQISQLTDKSKTLSNKIESEVETRLKPAMLLNQQAITELQSKLTSLYALKQNPSQWNTLSAERQQEINQEISLYEKQLQNKQRLQNLGTQQLDLVAKVLEKAQDIRQQAKDLVHKLLQQMIQSQKILSHPVLKNSGKPSVADEKALALIHKANQLSVHMQWDTTGAQSMIDQSLKWMQETEQFLLDNLKKQQREEVLEHTVRVHLDRSLAVVRENTRYHQTQLDKIHEVSE